MLRSPAAAPDLVLLDGDVVPDPGGATSGQEAPTALAVTGGVVTAVGSDDDVRALAGPGTRVVRLGGRTVLPGINDSHLHLVAWAAGRSLYGDVSGATSWAQVCAQAGAQPPDADGWVRLRGWDAARLDIGPDGAPDRAPLDAATGGRPVVLFDATGHQLVLNAEAMRRCGIGPGTADMTGGVVVRDAAGAPTGVLREGAMALAVRSIPEHRPERLRAAVVDALGALAGLGVTSLTEPGLGPGATSLLDGSPTSGALDVLAGLARDGELTARVTALLLFAGTGGGRAQDVVEAMAGLPALRERLADVDPSVLRVGGVKVFGDGIPRSRTAWMAQPYPDGGRGCLCLAGGTDDERTAHLAATVAAVDAAGLQVGCHVIGDAAVTAFVDAVEALPGRGAGRRHYVIHGDYASAGDLVRMAALGIGLNTNPAIRHAAGSLVRRAVGPERHARQQPAASALLAGVGVCLSSDAPVVEPDWRVGVVAAVTRRTRDTSPPPDDVEALTVTQALRSLTVAPAAQDHAETWKGRLLPGYAADLCVLDGRLPSDDVERLLTTPVALTVVGGREVHARL